MNGSRRKGPQAMAAPRLPAELKRGSMPAVVVLAGAERWFRARGTEAIIAKVLPDGDPGGAVVRLDGRLPDQRERIPGVLDELRSTSLFSSGKVVVVENPEGAPAMQGQGRKAALTHLAHQAMEHPAPGAVLVLSTGKGVKGRESVSTKSLLDKGAWVVDCRALYDAPGPWERGTAPHDHELARFVAQRMKQVHRKGLSLEDAHAITRRVGSDLAALDDALRSLALYVGAREAVTAEDVHTTVGETREDPIWRLVDAVLDGDVATALDLLAATFERGLHDQRGAVSIKPEALFPQLAAALHASFRRLLTGAEGLARGESVADVAKGAGVPPFLAERFGVRARRDPERLLALHGAFVDAEMGVKGGGVPPRVAAERLVARLVAGLSARRPGVPGSA
ncbi:MAG: hypothetical protein P1V36_12265 [Planctomycetota bacterium]|nr:hypothetical protein [Planctomycetota bacterium]